MGKEISPITIDRLHECGNVAYQSLFFVHFRRLTLMSYLPIPSANYRRSVTFAAMLRNYRAVPGSSPPAPQDKASSRRKLASRQRGQLSGQPMSALGHKRTFRSAIVMSALCQKRTLPYSFDHLIGAGEQRRRHGEAERLGVLRLITSSYVVGAWTGISAGFSPLRMRST